MFSLYLFILLGLTSVNFDKTGCRERDEDLDEITLSAQQLLGRLRPSLSKNNEEQTKRMAVDTFQMITMLALFVSDCFGGSDKTQNVTNMRRAALGGTAGAPFVCSCSSSLSAGSSNGFVDNGVGSSPGAALPSVHALCEAAVKYLKAQRGSNVVPLGSLRFGVCRHRAILLKVCKSISSLILSSTEQLNYMRFSFCLSNAMLILVNVLGGHPVRFIRSGKNRTV